MKQKYQPTQIPVISQKKEIENRYNALNYQCVIPNIQQARSNAKGVG